MKIQIINLEDFRGVVVENEVQCCNVLDKKG
jgi:hypothetical protein